MALFTSGEAAKAAALAELAFCNPFLPRRIELERVVLGAAAVGAHLVMHNRSGLTVEDAFPHLPRLGAEAEQLVTKARERLLSGQAASSRELTRYQDLVLYWLYSKHVVSLGGSDFRHPKVTSGLWAGFRDDYSYFLDLPERHFEREVEPAHIMACCVQIWRAFRNIFDYVVGASMPVTRLRAVVWQSIFTHDLHRYARALFETLAGIPTLITGPSGTGKELVAKAIALSRYIPFDEQTESFDNEREHLYSVNLSALAPTLVESELFGHVKGSFTGAVCDRKGWLEECGGRGTVFLDEIGELDPAIQVKLLRVIQERRFQRLGEAKDIQFRARIVAATHRDLAAAMRSGEFREDLYYRLCGDIVTTPSLREQLDDTPEDLANMVRFIVLHQLLPGSEDECESITDEAVSFITEKLPPDYAWPGNFRELEQCVRNILIRREYHPAVSGDASGGEHSADGLLAQLSACELSSDELLRQYYTLVYRRTGSYRAAAEVLRVDWRTVRDKVNTEPLDSLPPEAE